jgi:prophage maintenance system killer protein
MTAPKKRTDWEPIERDYRAGILSIREIAKIHAITDTAIRKKAKAEGWQRDLTERVKEKVRTELVRSEVRTANPQTEREIVDVAAATVVQVVREHRSRISQGAAIVALLLRQLNEAATQREEIEEAIAEETKGEKTTDRYSRMMRAVSLPMHATTVVNLSNALKNLVGLERQAFNIDGAPESSDPLGELMAHIYSRNSRLPVKE